MQDLKGDHRPIGLVRRSVSDRTVDLVVKSVLANQLAFFYNEEIKKTQYFKRELKRDLNAVLKTMLKIEVNEFNSFLDPLENQVDYLYNMQYDLMEKLAKVALNDYADIEDLIDAYLKKPKSIMGIANKINKE